MTVKECYDRMGGNYEEVMGRLRTEERVKKFVKKFPADGSFDLLVSSLAEANYADAFRAAHTLKGVCQNLSFTKLYESSHVLTEAVRGGELHPGCDLEALLAEVRADYELTRGSIEALD